MDQSQQETAPPKLRPHEVQLRLFGDDTSPEVERFLLDAYWRMSGGEKLERAWALNHSLGRTSEVRRHAPSGTDTN